MESKKLFFCGSLKCSFSDRNHSVPKKTVVKMCFPENADLGKVLRHVDRKEIIHHTVQMVCFSFGTEVYVSYGPVICRDAWLGDVLGSVSTWCWHFFLKMLLYNPDKYRWNPKSWMEDDIPFQVIFSFQPWVFGGCTGDWIYIIGSEKKQDLRNVFFCWTSKGCLMIGWYVMKTDKRSGCLLDKKKHCDFFAGTFCLLHFCSSKEILDLGWFG